MLKGALSLSLVATVALGGPWSKLDEYAFQSATIEATIRAAADYQLKNYGAQLPTKDWLVGTFFSSFVAAYAQTGDAWYLDRALEWSERSEWDINNPFHADDVCPGQTYLDLYFLQGGDEKIAQLRGKLGPLLGRTVLKPGELHEWDQEEMPFIGRHVWSWCDALYMAPPVYARMGKATGDTRYYDQLHALYWDTVAFLYDGEQKLFYRNNKAETETRKTPNGKQVFWGRGNGWVIGGLARTIPYLKPDDPRRADYIALFNDLAFSLAAYQGGDGLWRACVNDPEWLPEKETTGSAFFVYALAKGINEGWIPRAYFAPVVMRGWTGLMRCVSPEGRLGYCQLVAGSPHEVRPEDTKDYGVGAFILAGVEMLKLHPAEAMRADLAAPFKPRSVADDGAWTWYNDERVVFHDNCFYASYVRGDGKTALTAFGTDRKPSAYARKELVLSTWSQQDDHNVGAFLPLKDGGLLVCYGTHNMTKSFYQRKLKLPRWNEPKLGEENHFNVVETKRGLSYQNPHRVEAENGRIYNFFRGNNFNPHFVYSDDEAATWSEPIQLIRVGEGSQRPYIKYASNGKDRIDLLYTDGHPRVCKQNNIYHMYYSEGAFRKSDGTVIRTLEDLPTNPMQPQEGTRVFDGSTSHGRGWVWDLEYDDDGRPLGAFISSPSGPMGSDMRYWVADLSEKGLWMAEQVGFAGSNLYPKEEHYAGGIALNPGNEREIVISADVDPATGEPLPARKYQLFKGTRGDTGWTFVQLTHDPVMDHLRPVIVRGKNALFWFAGDYRTYADYDCGIWMSSEF